MKKRIISLLLAVIMIVGMLPFGAITAMAAEQQYPIKITGNATYSDMTFDMSGKTVEHIFEVAGGGYVTFQNITFMNVSGTMGGSCVYINSNNKVNFYNCRFINCSSKGNGGAIYVENANKIGFSDCYAANCHADGNGGFMYVNNSNTEVYGRNFDIINSDRVYKGRESVISGCTAGNSGGGIYMEYGKTIEDFFLADNTATGDGGGICNTANGATILNCRFYRNNANVDGGGLYTEGPTVENCKFFENSCGSKGYELNSWFSSTQINNCTFTSKYSGDNVVYGGMQSNCTFPDKSSYQLTVGDGSQENPYLIKSIDDWDALHYIALKRGRMYPDGTEYVIGDQYSLYGKYFRLDADITVCNTVGEVHDNATIGGAVLSTSYSEFNGNFDGNGHTVTYVSNTGSDRNGVFGYANSATVKNLTVNGYIKGGNRVGGLFGSTYNCTAENCTNNAFVYGTNDCVGGIAGHSECSNYIGCTNNGKVEGAHEQIGGIVGYSNGDTFNGCVNNGDVVGLQKCGGIVGVAHETDSLINGEHRAPKILNCINNATVTATYYYAGGIIGYEDGKVTAENCINTGKVNADATVSRYPAEGDYVIYAASDNKYCFDIQGGAEGLDEYRNLQLWTAQTSGAKVFTLKYYDKYDAYAIIAKHSGLALTADPQKDYSTVDGVNVYQFTNQPVHYQLWTFEPDNAGSYKIRSLESGFTMNVANGTACEGASIIAYKYGGNDSFKLVAEPNQVLKSVYANGITGRHFGGSTYEQCFYDKEKAIGDRYGIGLSTNAMNGISADIIDGKDYIMPNILNDDIIKNAPGTQNYLPVYFDENNNLSVAHNIDENYLTLGIGGKTTAYCTTKNETLFNDRVCVQGNVLLFLRDGRTLKAQKGITLENGNTMSVYGSADAEKAGKLISNGDGGNAGIGGIRGKDGFEYHNNTCDNGALGTNAGTLKVYGGSIYASGTVGFGGGHGGDATRGLSSMIAGYGGNGGNGGTLELFGGYFEAFGTDCAVGGGKGGCASGGDSIRPKPDGNAGTPTVISYEPNTVLYAGETAPSEIVSNWKMCQNKKYFKTINTKAVAVDCVSAIGGGYIDTTYQPNKNTRVVMDVDVWSSSEYWFGVWDENFNQKAFALGNDGGGVYAGYGNQGGTDNAGAVSSGRHTVELNKNKVYIDGEERTSIAFSDSSEGLPTQNSLYLFAQNRKGTPTNTGVVICYGCKIYENDKLIHEYIPMKDTVSGIGFLYDTVEKNAYRSANGLVLPGTVNENIQFAEYATVGGNAHFETDVYANTTKRVVMDVYVNDQSEDWFGCSALYISSYSPGTFCYRVSNCPDGVTVITGEDKVYVDPSGSLPNGRHTIDFRGIDFYIDGAFRAEITGGGPNKQPLCLFASIDNVDGQKTLQKSNPVTFYSCQIYNYDGNLLHDYAPAVIASTGESVLYDRVTKRVCYYNGDASKVTSYNLSEHCWRNLEATKAGISTLVSEATCTQGELYHKVCADCDIISEDTWEKPNTAKGHSWQPVDGGKHKCSVCYAEENHTDDGTGKCSKCGCDLFTENTFNGNGTKESPYLIKSFDDLTKLQYFVSGGIYFEGKYFKLTADIETPLTQSIGGAKPFNGIFDGDGHTVMLAVQGENNVGLFGATENATIKNVIVKGTVSGTGNAVGGIVGYAGNGTVILNCINTADITGFKYIGGIVGDTVADESKTVLIENCINYGDITALTGGENAGGIAGHMAHCGTLINCFTSGAVSNEGNSGIIVGWANRSFSIENSYYQTLDANSGMVAVKHDNGKTYSATAVSTADNADMITAMNEKADGNDGWYYWTVEDGRAWLTADPVKCDGISLTLSSDIYINFYMQLTDEALANGKMVFTIGGRKVEGVTAQLNESNGRYYFACPLNALEMAETVKAEFTYGSTTYTQTYSVKKYVETILTATDKDGKFVYTEKEQKLARKIANYGYYAQLYLASIHSSVKIGTDGYAQMLYFNQDDIDVDKAKELQDNFTATANTANLTFDGRTVYFDSATALNFYVIANDGKAPKATCDMGKNVEVKLYKDKTYIVSVKDISATELGDTFTVTIGEGTDSMTLKGSVLDYCAAVINAHRDKTADKDVKAVNAMAAFYEYYEAAKAYVSAASK